MIRLLVWLLTLNLACNTPFNKKEEQDSNDVGSETLLNPTFDKISFNLKIEKIIELFLQEDTWQSCIHEIYIDKIRQPRTDILISSRVFSSEYLKNCDPLFITKIKGINFYIYSRLEDVFIGDKVKISIGTSSQINPLNPLAGYYTL
jgi:hypothetical protein